MDREMKNFPNASFMTQPNSGGRTNSNGNGVSGSTGGNTGGNLNCKGINSHILVHPNHLSSDHGHHHNQR
jgi:hypothetical protein